jgi:hypothetical protein
MFEMRNVLPFLATVLSFHHCLANSNLNQSDEKSKNTKGENSSCDSECHFLFTFSIILICILLSLSIYCYFRWGESRRPILSNSKYINATLSNQNKEISQTQLEESEDLELIEISYKSFEDKLGFWDCEETSHGICNKNEIEYRCYLYFDNEKKTVTGHGVDKMGKFSINGVYNIQTSRMAFVKTYTNEKRLFLNSSTRK